MSQTYRLLDNELIEQIANSSPETQAEWLILSASEEFRGRWSVDSLHAGFFFDFEDIIGHYKTVAPSQLREFIDRAQEADYKLAFVEPPEIILDQFNHLKDPPPFSIESSLDETVNGFLPWQIVGFNKLIRDESLNAGLFIYDTGTGKTVSIAMGILWHRDHGHPFDLALVVVKSINKIDTQRKLLRLAGIESIVIDGLKEKRIGIYKDILDDLKKGKKVVAITNYEKFREDEAYFKNLVSKRDVLFFWDEMPTRLSNRNTQLWKAVKRTIWKSHWSKQRPKWFRSWELTATPLENSPEDQMSAMSLMCPDILGTVGSFHQDYVSYTNPLSRKPEKWKNLDKLEAKLEFMTHRVSRKDSEIAKFFPNMFHDPLTIDWNPIDRKIYDTLANMMKKDAEIEEPNILAMIQIMQMMCDAPSMIVQSGHNREAFEKLLRASAEDETDIFLEGPKGSEIALELLSQLPTPPNDDTHTKFQMLKEILTVKHPNEKVLIYMTWASYGWEPLTRKLDEWDISYVKFTGTDKQRQVAKDEFRKNPDIRVFLSSDAGSDSLDLPEASVGVNYNYPWKWTTITQREGRNNRVDSELDITYWYDLVMANSVDERKKQIIDRKHGYHQAIYDGHAIDESISSGMTKEDLLFILLGD